MVQNLEDIRPYVELTRPYLEGLTAVAFGAVSGALHGKRRSFDFTGVVIIGIVSGLGGGLIRDVLIGRGPVLALRSPEMLIVAIVASLTGVLLFEPIMTRASRIYWVVEPYHSACFRCRTAAGPGSKSCGYAERVTWRCHLRRRRLGARRPVPGDARVLLPGQPYTTIALFAGVVYMLALHA